MSKKTFAFRLKTKNQKPSENNKKWQAQEGLAAAGCTDPSGWYDYRYSSSQGIDAGVYC